jgi:acyl-ACP thioesterase
MYTFDGRIRFSEVDSEGRLTLSALINYFQDCSTFQSEDLGIGVNYLKEQHRVWVLSSWQIVVERYPKLCENIITGTKPYDFKGFFGYRNFSMTDREGGYYAKASSLWTFLDTDTWKPVMPSQIIHDKYALEDRLDMEYAPRKIAVPSDGINYEPITVRKHNIDTNHHVNNGQYVDMAMEMLPENFVVGQMRAEYKKQAFLDDVLYPYVVGEENKYIISLNDAQGKPYVVVEFSR